MIVADLISILEEGPHLIAAKESDPKIRYHIRYFIRDYASLIQKRVYLKAGILNNTFNPGTLLLKLKRMPKDGTLYLDGLIGWPRIIDYYKDGVLYLKKDSAPLKIALWLDNKEDLS